ncbi:MAG: hypothetical protein QME75_16175 [Deltaproteobacteria bacterium]|nr:hypothetical protein [Deltaproteobacteria bacterium]
MSHTPGPWEVFGKPGKNLFGDDLDVSIVDKKGYEIADCSILCYSLPWLKDNPDKHPGSNTNESCLIRDNDEVIANAQLIAAAPELLQACKKAETQLKMLQKGSCPLCYEPGDNSEYGNKHHPDCALVMLRKAIAKATS